MMRVSAPSRLHFGLLNTGHVPGVPPFGGCGLMIDTPGVCVRVEPAAHWSAEGPNAERALAFARRVTTECHRVVVEHCPPEHVGLGVGTALGLAVAQAIRPAADAAELARLTGRGQRSGVGLFGFCQGGFIEDGGKPAEDCLPRLTRRLAFPESWRVVLVQPPLRPAWYGATERQAFAESTVTDPGRLHQTLVQMMVHIGSALDGRADFPAFCEAVYTFNREGGRWFESAQGGLYADPAIAALIGRIRRHGFSGTGQSSWGPTVFAFTPDPEQADWLRARLQLVSPELHLVTATARNHGASTSRG